MVRLLARFLLVCLLCAPSPTWAKTLVDGLTVEVLVDLSDHPDLQGKVVVSPDGKQVAFVEQASKRPERYRVVVNGKGKEAYEQVFAGSLRFSPDGARLAYVAQKGRTMFVVLGDEELDRCRSVGESGVQFAPVGSRYAYVAEVGLEKLVMSDTGPGPGFESVTSPVFSPDGKRLAYVGGRGQKQFVVLAGKESGPYEEVLGNPVFSPDSSHLAWVVQGADGVSVVTEQGQWLAVQGIGDGTPLFGIDSKHLASIEKVEDGWRVTVDGRPGPVFDGVVRGSIVALPSGGFAYVAGKGKSMSLMVGTRCLLEAPMFRGGAVVVPGAEELAFVEVHENWERLHTPVGPLEKHQAVASPVWSEDGKHFARLTVDSDQVSIRVDDAIFGPYLGAGVVHFLESGHWVAEVSETARRCLVVDGTSFCGYENSVGIRKGSLRSFGKGGAQALLDVPGGVRLVAVSGEGEQRVLPALNSLESWGNRLPAQGVLEQSCWVVGRMGKSIVRQRLEWD